MITERAFYNSICRKILKGNNMITEINHEINEMRQNLENLPSLPLPNSVNATDTLTYII